MAENKVLKLEDVQQAFPNRKNSVTQEAVDIINKAINDPEFQGESLLHTAINYESVLQRNRASIPEYLNAIRFCSYMISNDDNFTEAYKKVFWERDFVKERANAPTESTKYKELTSAASRYRKSKLVVDILTVSQVPLDLMFTGARMKAAGVLAELMMTAKYDKDRIAAADKLLQHTAGPETRKIELELGVKQDSAVQQLNEQLALMAAKQKAMLEVDAGKLKDFGAMKVQADIIDAEIIE
jgi:hypothetical protein